MKDKHGNHLQVKDLVQHDNGGIGQLVLHNGQLSIHSPGSDAIDELILGDAAKLTKIDLTKAIEVAIKNEQLPPKVQRIVAVVAKRWGDSYPGSTAGMIGKDAIEVCDEYGIDPE